MCQCLPLDFSLAKCCQQTVVPFPVAEKHVFQRVIAASTVEVTLSTFSGSHVLKL